MIENKHTKKEEKTVEQKTSRRNFLGKVGNFGLAAAVLGVSTSPKAVFAQQKRGERFPPLSNVFQRRARESMNLRTEAAKLSFRATEYEHPQNGDESLYPNKIASFSKTLPHNSLGEVDLNAFGALVTAIKTERSSAFENIPLGGTVKLANPQAAFSFQLDGTDNFSLTMPPPPTFASEETAAEIAEVYWHSVARDIHFSDYSTNSTIQAAVKDLNRFSRFNGVTAETIFRGETPGDHAGPYISQFLIEDIPYGPSMIPQAYTVPIAGQKFMTDHSEWLNIQNGAEPSAILNFDPTLRFIRNGQDMASYVHTDYSFQAYLNAALILLNYGDDALNLSNPYNTSSTQSGFVQFGTPHVVDMVSRAGLSALKVAWWQKWYMHRRLRPEVFAGRIHNHKTGNANYPIDQKILDSPVLDIVNNQNGSYLLPLAYSEGSPTHPAFPAGHATIAGACVTILKAFFNEDFVMPNPVVASADGTSLENYSGDDLTTGNELNKLAANISIGRDTAGVHWRSDGIEGMKLGEKVAITMLENYKDTYNEPFNGFPIRKFDGSVVVVGQQPTRQNFNY